MQRTNTNGVHAQTFTYKAFQYERRGFQRIKTEKKISHSYFVLSFIFKSLLRYLIESGRVRD